MAKESICRNCFHSYVCEQFNENKDENNEKCHFFNDHYTPTADVAPIADTARAFADRLITYCKNLKGATHPALEAYHVEQVLKDFIKEKENT